MTARKGCAIVIPVMVILLGYSYSIHATQESERSKNIKWESQQICDANKEVSLIKRIEDTLSRIVESERTGSKQAFKLLKNPLSRFVVFQRGNGGLYITGPLGNEFHSARNQVMGLSGESDNLVALGNDEVPTSSRNVLRMYRDQLARIRDRLTRQIKNLKEEFQSFYSSKPGKCLSAQKRIR